MTEATPRPAAIEVSESASLQSKIVQFFSQKLSAVIASEQADLFETGALDSLAFVELLLYLEQQFGIRISVEELEMDDFRTVAKIAEFIASRNASIGGVAA